MQRLLVLAIVMCATVPAMAQAPKPSRLSDASFKDLLSQLCKGRSEEPVCSALSDISQDQAWLILRSACSPLPAGVSPCQEFWQGHGGVLIYDWLIDGWRAEWEMKQHPLKFDVAGVPTARLKPRDARPLRVMIDGISPLTYSAIPGTPKEEDLAVIAGLKSFLAAAGTALQGAVQTIAFSSPTLSPAQDVPQTVLAERDRVGITRQAQTARPVCKPRSPDAVTLADAVTNRLQQILNMSGSIATLDAEVERLAAKRISFIKVAQKVEDALPVTRAELVEPDVAALERAYAALQTANKSLSEHTDLLATCQPLMAAYVHLLSGPPNAPVMKSMAARITNSANWACNAAAVKPIADSITQSAGQLVQDIDGCEPAALKTHLDTHRDTMKPMVERLLNAKQVEEKLWTAIAKANEARKEVLAGADVLARRLRAAQRHTWNGHLIPALVVTRQSPELPWNKVQTHEIVAKADSPYVKELTLRRGAEEKRAYKLESATGQIIGYGIGLIYTPLHESTYSAVTVPGESIKVIRETERATRAGDLAAFLTYRFLEHRPKQTARRIQPVLDVGVGLTSDRPAFFVGPALEISRAARIGIGWAPQRVSTLDGQTVDVTVVSESSEIRTKKTFDVKNFYVSFSFALDSLSLFNSK
jgi:hypothetical protein